MTTEAFLQVCALIAIAILIAAFFVISVRIVIGPTLPDRVLALDMLVAAGIGFIAVVAIKTGFFLYLDIAIALGLVGFLATVAFARFVLKRDTPLEPEDEPQTNASKAHPPHEPDAAASAKVRARTAGGAP